MEKLIQVKQLPIIEQRLLTIKSEIQAKVNSALELAVTKETVKDVKKVRTDLSKTFKELEDARKSVKAEVMKPYEQFEEIYKDCVTNVFKPADNELKRKIDDVENKLKENKKGEITLYFNEYAKSKDIDFLSFDNAGITIDLTVSEKKLKELSTAYIDKVVDEIALINTQPDDMQGEIFVEYKGSLNVAQAITIVSNRRKAIEDERVRLEAQKIKAEEQQKTVEKVDAVIEEEITAPVQMPIVSTVEEVKPVVAVRSDKTYELSFKVIGSLEQMKFLKNFLVEGAYDYEQL